VDASTEPQLTAAIITMQVPRITSDQWNLLTRASLLPRPVTNAGAYERG